MKNITKFTAAVVLMGMASTGASAADFNMRFHTLVKAPHPFIDIANYFKKELEAKSKGRISVKIFPAASLGKDPAVIGEMGLGTIDFMVSSTNNAVKHVPEYGVFSLPYLFSSFDGLMKAVSPGRLMQMTHCHHRGASVAAPEVPFHRPGRHPRSCGCGRFDASFWPPSEGSADQ